MRLNQLKNYSNLIQFIGKTENLEINNKDEFSDEFIVFPVDELIIGIKYNSYDNSENEKKRLEIELKTLNNEIIKINISPETLKEEKGIIEDLIMAAHNNAKIKLKSKTSEEISKATLEMGIPGLKFPF